MYFAGQGQSPPIVLGCRRVNPFQQEAGKASAGGPSSESSVLIQKKAKRPLRGGHSSSSSSQQRLTRLGGAGDGLANLVKTSLRQRAGEREAVSHSFRTGGPAGQRVRLEAELGADGEAGEEQGRGLQLPDAHWTLRADPELDEGAFPHTRPGRLHSKRPRAQGFDSQADQLVHSFMTQTGNVHQVSGSVLSTSCAEINPHLKAWLSVLGADEKQGACL